MKRRLTYFGSLAGVGAITWLVARPMRGVVQQGITKTVSILFVSFPIQIGLEFHIPTPAVQ